MCRRWSKIHPEVKLTMKQMISIHHMLNFEPGKDDPSPGMYPYVLFFLGWTQKIDHKQTHLGTHWLLYFFPTPSNQSTLHQNVFVLTALAQAVGWKTMSKCGFIRGWRKKNKMINMCPKCVCLGKSLVNFLSLSKKNKLHIICTVYLNLKYILISRKII